MLEIPSLQNDRYNTGHSDNPVWLYAVRDDFLTEQEFVLFSFEFGKIVDLKGGWIFSFTAFAVQYLSLSILLLLLLLGPLLP